MLTVLFVAALVVVMLFQHLLLNSFYPWLGLLPNDPMLAALAILDKAPVIVRLYFTSPICLHSYMYLLLLRLQDGHVGANLWTYEYSSTQLTYYRPPVSHSHEVC